MKLAFQQIGKKGLGKRLELILLTPIAGFFFSLIWLPLEPDNKVLLALILAILAVAVFNLKAAFLALLFCRPLLDLSVSNVIFSYQGMQVNVLSIAGIAMIAFALVLPLRRRQEIEGINRNSIYGSWLAFLLLGAITLGYSFYPGESIKEILRYSSIFTAFIIAASTLSRPKEISNLIRVIIWSALPVALLAFNQLLTNTGLPEGNVYRVFGSMTHPNMLAFYLLLPISLCIFLLLSFKRTRLESYIYLFLGLFYSLCLFFTYTRGAYLALLLILGIVGIVRFKKFLFASLAFLLLVYVLVPPLQGRFNSIFQPDPYGSMSWRISLWRDGYSYFQNRPWQGYGLGTAERVIAANRDFRLGSPDPHNDYLRIALDGGWFLIAAYAFLAASLCLFLLNAYRNERRPKMGNLLLFFLAISLSVFLMSAGDNILNDTALQWQFWALAGAIVATYYRKPDLVA